MWSPIPVHRQAFEARTPLDESDEASSTLQVSVGVRDLEVFQIAAQSADQHEDVVGAVE